MAKKSDELRRRAEEIIRLRKDIPELNIADQNVNRLIEELSIYQVELELQNEELVQKHIELEEVKEGYEDLFEMAPNGYLIIDEQLVIHKCNLTFSQLLGFSKPEFRNKKLTGFIHPDSQDIAFLSFRKLFEDEQPCSFELRLKSRKQGWICCRLDTIIEKYKKETKNARVVIVDISEQKKKEEKIRFQAKLLETVGDAVIATDTDGKIIYFNKAAENLYKWRVNEASGKNLIGLIFSEFHREKAGEITEYVMEGNKWEGEFEVQDKNGRKFPVHVIIEPIFDKDGNLIGMIGSSNDISKMISARQEIKKQAENRKRILESISDGFFVLDKETRVEYFNESAEKLLGRNRHEVLGKPLFEAFPEAKGSVFEDNYLEAIKKQEFKSFEVYFDVEPYKHWYDIRVYPNNGGITVYFQVITKRKKLELSVQAQTEEITTQNEELIVQNEEIRKNNERLLGMNNDLKFEKERAQHYLDIAGVMFIALDKNGTVILANKKASEILGYPVEQIMGKNWFDHFLPGKHIEAVKEVFGKVTSGNIKPVEFYENPVVNRDGNERIIAWHNSVLRDERNRIIGLLSSGDDISEKKKAEEEVIRSEKKYRSLFNNIQEGVALHEIILDDKGKPVDFIFLDVNPNYEEITKLKKKDVVGKKGLEVIPNLERKWIDAYGSVALTGKPVTIIDHSDYLDKYWEVKAYSPAEMQFAVALTDITEHKLAQDALKESQRRLNLLMNNLPGMAYRCNNDEYWTMQFVSEGSYKLTGYKPQELIGNNKIAYSEIIKPEERKQINEKVQTAIMDKKPFKLVYRIITKSGKEKWVWEQGQAVQGDADNVIALEGFITDITDRINSEQALKESEEKFRASFEASDIGMAIVDDKGKFLSVNQTTCKLFGYTEKQLLKIDYKMITHSEDIERSVQMYQKCMEDHKPYTIEKKYVSKKGAVIIGLTTVSPVMDFKGEFLYSVVHLQDMTERKQSEIALKDSQERFNYAMNATYDGLFDWDLVTNEIYYSPGWKKMLGYQDHELENKFSVWETLTDPEGVKNSWKMLDEHIKGKLKRFELEFKMKHRDGHWVEILSRAEAIRDKKGRAVRVVGTHVDITHRKQAERELKNSEERFRELVNTINSGVAIYEVMNDGRSGNDYIIQDFNKFALEHEKMKKKEVIGKSLEDIRPNINDYGLIDVFRRVWKTGKPEFFPAKIYVDEKYSNYYENRVFRLSGKEIVAVYDDVTISKKAEISLKASEEKFKGVFNYSNIGIVLTDTNYRILEANTEFVSMLGYSRKKLLSMKVSEITNKEDYEKEIQILESLKAQEIKDYRIEKRYIDINGEVIWVDLAMTSWKNQEGEIEMLIGMAMNINENKKAEKELKRHRNHLVELVRERTRELEEKNRELEHFNSLFIGREFRINELKEKISELEKELKKKHKN